MSAPSRTVPRPPVATTPGPAATGRRGAVALVALAALAYLVSAPGQSYGLAVFVDDILADTALGRTEFSILYALATVVSAAMVVAAGAAIDGRGPGTVWMVAAAGLAGACLLLSVAGGAMSVLVALSLIRGFGQGSFPLLAVVIVATRFSRRRGRAQGVAAQGTTIAGLVFPLAAAGLIGIAGWRHALHVIAVALLVAVLPVGLLVRRLAPRALAGGAGRPSLRGAARRPGVVRLLLILAVPPLVITAVVIHSVSLVERAGAGRGVAALALALMAATSAAGAAGGGLLVDRHGPRVVLGAIGLVLTVALALTATAAIGPVIAGLMLLGAAGGLSVTANGTIWTRSYGLPGVGGLQGLAGAGQVAGAALGPLPLAVSLEATGGYLAGIVLLAAVAVWALVAGWAWRPGQVAPTAPRP